MDSTTTTARGTITGSCRPEIAISMFSPAVMAYNGFEHDVRYLKNCSYKREASAVGAAKHFLSEYIQHL